LLRYASSTKQAAPVRQEALIALRFAQKGNKPDAKLLGALVSAAESDDRTLAQTALITLSAIELPARTAGRLQPLLGHPDLERARFVIDMLSHRKGSDAVDLLVEVVRHQELRRARLAAEALRDREEAVAPLVDALVGEEDPERARLLAGVLRPRADALKPAARKKLLTAALDRLASGQRAWDALYDVAREADPASASEGLRALYQRLAKRKDGVRATFVLRMLCRTDAATSDDRYQLASRLLSQSHRDTSAASRRDDEALRLIERLLREGHDVAAALRRDRSVDLDAIYYVGFHFIEHGHPLGEELLRQVVDKAGRKKIAKMARNKLLLAGSG
jgi:hypothetical protein